jgi:hypothetical protein
MQLNYFIVAGHAVMEPDGRLFMLNGDVDMINIPASNFPVTVTSALYVVGSILLLPSECNRDCKRRIELITPDGTVLESADHTQFIDPILDGSPYRKLGFVTAFFQLTFPVTGTYSIRMLVDGNEVVKRILRVGQSAPAQTS